MAIRSHCLRRVDQKSEGGVEIEAADEGAIDSLVGLERHSNIHK